VTQVAQRSQWLSKELHPLRIQIQMPPPTVVALRRRRLLLPPLRPQQKQHRLSIRPPPRPRQCRGEGSGSVGSPETVRSAPDFSLRETRSSSTQTFQVGWLPLSARTTPTSPAMPCPTPAAHRTTRAVRIECDDLRHPHLQRLWCVMSVAQHCQPTLLFGRNRPHRRRKSKTCAFGAPA
jgi:hypothetical protein